MASSASTRTTTSNPYSSASLPRYRDVATVEVLPQDLALTSAPECYERLGTLAQMNPPLREARHQAAPWRAVNDGTVEVMGSDDAPHTLEEKAKPYPQSPSVLPGAPMGAPPRFLETM